MAMVHGRPDWWIEPHTDDGASPSAAPWRAVTVAGIRPLGPRSWFGSRPAIEVCLNCGGWIHPGRGAWFDPDSREALCAGCWPESVTARLRR